MRDGAVLAAFELRRRGPHPKGGCQVVNSSEHVGADGRIRTGDLLITNQLLYQLSYVGIGLA